MQKIARFCSIVADAPHFFRNLRSQLHKFIRTGHLKSKISPAMREFEIAIEPDSAKDGPATGNAGPPLRNPDPPA